MVCNNTFIFLKKKTENEKINIVKIKVWLTKECTKLFRKVFISLVYLLSFILEMEEIMTKTKELFAKMSKKKGIKEKLTRIIKAGSDEAAIQNLRERLKLLSEAASFITLVQHVLTLYCLVEVMRKSLERGLK